MPELPEVETKSLKLAQCETLLLKPRPPFAFDPTFHKPDHFTSGDNHWEPGTRWQTWRWRGDRLGLKFESRGSINKPEIRLHIFSIKPLAIKVRDALVQEVSYRYNLDLDLSPFYQRFKTHPVVGPIIKCWRGMRPGHPYSLYEYLVIGVVLQNASVRRSVQMFQVLLEAYGTELKFDGRCLWCFWRPGGLVSESEEDLRALKIGYRAKYLKHIDEQFVAGLIDEMTLRGKDRVAQMEELLKIYGVGPATVWYLLFDVFHRLDFFNHVSPWEQKLYSKLFFDRDPSDPVPVKKLLDYIEQFGEYRQLAVHYIWEDLWWKRKNEHIPWLEKEIRL